MKDLPNSEALDVLSRLHHQWFAEDDVALDDDVGLDNDDDDADDDDVPILLEGRDEIPSDEPVGPSSDELQSRLDELEAQKQAYEQRLADREAMSSGFNQMAELLKRQQEAGQQSALQQPGESYDALKKRLSKAFYDDPVAAVEEMLKHVVTHDVAPAFQNLQGELSKTARLTSRQVAAQSDTNKMILERFGDEVEEMVKSLPSTPDVYEKACQQVGMQHLTDLVQWQVEQTTATAAPASRKPTSNVKPSTTGPASRGTGTAAPAKRRVLSRAEQATADAMGLSYEAYWNYLHG